MCKVFAFLLIPAVNAFFSVVPTVRPALSTSLGAFGVTASISVKEDKRDEFLDIIQANAEKTMRTEMGAICYDWGESSTERNTFHFQEQYLDEEG